MLRGATSFHKEHTCYMIRDIICERALAKQKPEEIQIVIGSGSTLGLWILLYLLYA